MQRGVHENTRLHYHPVGGLINIVRRKSKAIKALRLLTLGQSRKLLRRARTLDEHKKFVMVVGKGNVPRLHALVRTALRCKAGITRIVAMVDAAGKRVYMPKGYEEEELLRGILFLRMGGERVAELAHRTCGLPAVSTLRRSSLTQPLRPSPKAPRAEEVAHNIDVSFPLKSDAPRDHPETLSVLMFDEIKVTEAAPWCPSTNKVLGFCREHTQDSVLDFETIKEVEQLCDDLNQKKIHLASEATVAAIGKLCGNPREYSVRPILISGTCKKESGLEHARVIQTVLDACIEKQSRTGCRIISVASDGESRRGLALEQLFLDRLVAPSSPIYELLASLKLFNLQVGKLDISLDKDYKHVLKRLRNLALRRSGFVIHGVHITPGQLRRHLAAAGASPAHLDLVLNPRDKQHVAVMFTLLRDIWSLPAPLPTDLPGFAATRNALRTFGRLCYYLVMPYLQIDLSLSEQLEYLSAAAHLAIDAYTFDNSGKECMSPQLFLDIMHMVKNAYMCVAKVKVADPDGKFWLILLGTDRLETAFGILRTIVGNDTNADVLQKGTRVSHVVECANILARFPHWDRALRRLHASPVTASGEMSRAADHVNPASWKGDVSVRTVVLQTCWQRG
ncbi:hypothetical protein AURDEDRAFT_64635 [Auricularia subglabra TFB-10046 SS5]|nr:hypothetical protein AURDEDRAFT_64635 [Auricularia subglabra TFB-10046 SS5]